MIRAVLKSALGALLLHKPHLQQFFPGGGKITVHGNEALARHDEYYSLVLNVKESGRGRDCPAPAI